MRLRHTVALFALLLPNVIFAQASLQAFAVNIVLFINNVVIYFLLGLAFLMFVINAIRYFVLGSTSEEGREKAKNLALYSIIAFVIIIIFWGIVNLFVVTLGLDTSAPPFDFCTQFGAPGTCI
ncbi:MAG: hypothetical protein AAB388_04825 [Patescibacteria group bacterium]